MTTPATNLREQMIEAMARAIHERFVAQHALPDTWPTWDELIAEGHQARHGVEATRTLASAALAAIAPVIAKAGWKLVPKAGTAAPDPFSAEGER